MLAANKFILTFYTIIIISQCIEYIEFSIPWLSSRLRSVLHFSPISRNSDCNVSTVLLLTVFLYDMQGVSWPDGRGGPQREAPGQQAGQLRVPHSPQSERGDGEHHCQEPGHVESKLNSGWQSSDNSKPSTVFLHEFDLKLLILNYFLNMFGFSFK